MTKYNWEKTRTDYSKTNLYRQEVENIVKIYEDKWGNVDLVTLLKLVSLYIELGGPNTYCKKDAITQGDLMYIDLKRFLFNYKKK